MRRLSHVHLQHNRLTHLPPLGSLAHLTVLDLRCNLLTALPGVGGRIRYLGLRGNKIEGEGLQRALPWCKIEQ
ncbi:hypothetical protein B484DRAFT_459787 [Ochromonadaceae sp. CCMP2298]|nr:hypothetical protein B484DRAFT_459787 [Ochromonadaceae sp. CCMP2298]